MCRTVLMIVCLATIVLASVARAEVIVVPATTPDGVYSSPLLAGVPYVFEASGVATNAYGQAYFDAEWQTEPNSSVWWEYDPTPSGEWGETTDILDILINDTAVSWMGTSDGISWAAHTYSGSHVYRYYYTGTGSPVKFHIADPTPFPHSEPGESWYHDNAGSLAVSVSVVPEPSSLLVLVCGLGGLLSRRRLF